LYKRPFLCINTLYSMFTQKFYSVLEEDILSLDKPRPHHHAPVRGINRKDQREVPEIHRNPIIGVEAKIKNLQDGKMQQTPINKTDIIHLIKKYNITDLSPGTSKQCGNTGIHVVVNDPNYITGTLFKQ